MNTYTDKYPQQRSENVAQLALGLHTTVHKHLSTVKFFMSANSITSGQNTCLFPRYSTERTSVNATEKTYTAIII